MAGSGAGGVVLASTGTVVILSEGPTSLHVSIDALRESDIFIL